MKAVSKNFIIPAVPTIVLAFVVPISIAAPSQAQPSDQRMWNETGEPRHGRLEPQLGPASPVTAPSEIDPASREQVEQRWQRLRDKTRAELARPTGRDLTRIYGCVLDQPDVSALSKPSLKIIDIVGPTTT